MLLIILFTSRQFRAQEQIIKQVVLIVIIQMELQMLLLVGHHQLQEHTTTNVQFITVCMEQLQFNNKQRNSSFGF